MEEELLRENSPFNPIVIHKGSLGTILPKHSSVHSVAYGLCFTEAILDTFLEGKYKRIKILHIQLIPQKHFV